MSTPARILMVQGDTSPSAPTAGQILFYAKTDGVFYSKNSSNVETPLGGGGGTVSSVNASGGTTGMNFTGGPITGSGTLTLTGTLGVANGGTGATTQAGAAAAILPAQTGQGGKFLTTDGTNVSWATVTGTGTVTSVGLTSANSAISVAGSPITTSGSFTITANNFTNTEAGIVPASGGGTTNFLRADGTWAAPAGTGTVTSVTVNGSTGRITSSGSPITTSGSITLDLAPSGVTANTYGSATQVPVFTVDTYGRITSVTNTTITGGGTGTVTSVAASGNNGITVSGSPITTSGTLTLGLGAITPTSVAATGTVTGSNLSGTNTGDQTITLTGDVTGSGTGSFAATLSATGVTANTYGSATQVPVFTVDSKGRITSVTNTTITAGSGTVTSVGVSSNGTYQDALTIGSSPVTTAGTITITPNVFTSSTPGVVPSSGGGTTNFLRADGTWAAPAGGSGTVTSVAASGSTDISVGGSPITTSGTLTFALTDTGVTANTYGDATTVPQFTVDAKGRITNVTGVPISAGGSSAPEIVIWHYSSGGSGNFTAVDALFSQTSGVSATVTDGANAIATYAFTGKSNPPKSITTYGQTYATNNFTIKDTTSLPSAIVAGGGSAATPDLLSAFTASNIVTLQTRMSDVGASAGLGQRAWLIVVFGF